MIHCAPIYTICTIYTNLYYLYYLYTFVAEVEMVPWVFELHLPISRDPAVGEVQGLPSSQ